jgi:hypothetical protein
MLLVCSNLFPICRLYNVSAQSERFQANAAECEKWAQETKDLVAKEMFKRAAQEWRDLADYYDRMGW